MNIKKTKIKDCFIIEPSLHEDNRGYFFESFNKKEFEEKTGLSIDFVQENQSLSKGYVLRGLHFQKGCHAQAKLVKVSKGSVYDVAVDLREDSPTYGEYVGVVLSENNCTQLFIPRGCAHGFVTLSPNETVFQYKCDNYYNKEAEDGIAWNDKTININWDEFVDTNMVTLSEKDKKLKPISVYHFKEKKIGKN